MSPKNVANIPAIDVLKVKSSFRGRKLFWGKIILYHLCKPFWKMYTFKLFQRHCITWFQVRVFGFQEKKGIFPVLWARFAFVFLRSHGLLKRKSWIQLRNTLLESKLRLIKEKPGTRLNSRSLGANRGDLDHVFVRMSPQKVLYRRMS